MNLQWIWWSIWGSEEDQILLTEHVAMIATSTWGSWAKEGCSQLKLLYWNMQRYSMCNKNQKKPLSQVGFEHDPSDLNIPEVYSSIPGSRIRNFRVLSSTSTKDNANRGFLPWHVHTPRRREQEDYFWWTSKSSEILCIKFSFSCKVRLVTRVPETIWRSF